MIDSNVSNIKYQFKLSVNFEDYNITEKRKFLLFFTRPIICDRGAIKLITRDEHSNSFYFYDFTVSPLPVKQRAKYGNELEC